MDEKQDDDRQPAWPSDKPSNVSAGRSASTSMFQNCNI